MTDPSRAAWRTSSYSNIGGNCVEVATAGGIVCVRDSQDRPGPVLTFSPQAWRRFAARAQEPAKG
jgi:hypothetical protein